MTTLLAVGTAKGLWLGRRATPEAEWSWERPHLLAREVASVAIDTRRSPARLLVGVHSEHWGPTVMWSDDLGVTWQETPEGAIQFPDDTGASLARVWQLTPDTAGRPEVVWAGCEPTSLWRSEDGGRSFHLVRDLWDHPHRPNWAPGFGGAAVHTVLPHPTDDRLVVAMSTGGVYVSPDGRSGWQPHNKGISAYFLPGPEPEYGQCVHKVAVDAGGSDRMYAQNHHGVYRTDDAARSWQSIAEGLPSDFGFPIVASPSVPGTAWVVPLVADSSRVPPEGKLRVHRTRDGGQTWTELGNGLPDDCWVAVLRDAMHVDASGLYLGTRDGCVYVSTDDGDTFTTAAQHLPHVLVVRAAELP